MWAGWRTSPRRCWWSCSDFCLSRVSSRIVGLIGSLGEPGLGHDDRDADGDVGDLPGEGMDGAGVWRAGHHDWRRGVHRGVERRRHIAGSEDGLPDRATPWKQQVALMIGVVVSTVAIGFTLNLMNTGLQEFRAAPQPWNMQRAASGRVGTERCEAAARSSFPCWGRTRRIDCASQATSTWC